MGDSRGYWDGDTLVVETKNIGSRPGVGVNGGGTATANEMTITERFTRVTRHDPVRDATLTTRKRGPGRGRLRSR